MSGHRRFWPDGALDISPRPPRALDLEAEARWLCERAVHGRELADVIALARSPLPPDEDGPELDEELEAALAARMAADLALRAERAALLSSGAFKPRPRPRAQSRRPAKGAPATASATPRLPHRYRVDFQRRQVLTASGQVIRDGWPLAVKAASGVLFLPRG